MNVAAILETPFRELGRVALILGRVLAWTPRPPYDVSQLLQQMVRVGIQSVPVVLLTALFTGMVMALQIFTVLSRFGAERLRRLHRRPGHGARAGARCSVR